MPLCPDVRQALHSEHSTSVTDTETARPDLTALVDLVAKLNADLVAKAEAAAMWQTRAAVLEAELARLRDLAALGPGRDEIVMTVPSSRPWWAFWRR